MQQQISNLTKQSKKLPVHAKHSKALEPCRKPGVNQQAKGLKKALPMPALGFCPCPGRLKVSRKPINVKKALVKLKRVKSSLVGQPTPFSLSAPLRANSKTSRKDTKVTFPARTEWGATGLWSKRLESLKSFVGQRLLQGKSSHELLRYKSPMSPLYKQTAGSGQAFMTLVLISTVRRDIGQALKLLRNLCDNTCRLAGHAHLHTRRLDATKAVALATDDKSPSGCLERPFTGPRFLTGPLRVASLPLTGQKQKPCEPLPFENVKPNSILSGAQGVQNHMKPFLGLACTQQLISSLSNPDGLTHRQHRIKRSKKFTVIRSPFVYKKTREQFGLTTMGCTVKLRLSQPQQQIFMQLLCASKLPVELKVVTYH